MTTPSRILQRQASRDTPPLKVSAQGEWVFENPAPSHGIFTPHPCEPPEREGGLRSDDHIGPPSHQLGHRLDQLDGFG